MIEKWTYKFLALDPTIVIQTARTLSAVGDGSNRREKFTIILVQVAI